MTTACLLDVHQLASFIKNRIPSVLIIDSRSFIEHNACHISSAVNVCCSKIVKRRLQQDKICVRELLIDGCHCDVDEKSEVVVYDQCSKDIGALPADSFILILLKKLQLLFHNVNLLSGGFEEFHKHYPELCEDKTRKCTPAISLSQPCLPIANQGPTRILPFLYLGSQFDAINKELLKDHNITYELNVSTSCPQPEFVQEGHFMRIPVNDTYNEKLLPYFPEAFNFLDKVREGSGCVLVHCLAGISRSPTVAIAYVMRYLRLPSDDGYRYVKSKRPTISPNFNFLGQLLEYEKQLRKENILDCEQEISSAPPLCKKRLCRTDMRTTKLSLDIDVKKNDANIFIQPRSGDQSPTTALAKLSFDGHNSVSDKKDCKSTDPDFQQYRSKSCYGDWLRNRDDFASETKGKDSNLLISSKILSPVKEIKCDALISEISSGGSGKKLPEIRQHKQSLYRGQEKQSIFFPFNEKQNGSLTPERIDKFNIQTLSHQSIKATLFSKTKPREMKSKLNSIQCNDSETYLFTTEEIRGTESRAHGKKSNIKNICNLFRKRLPTLVTKDDQCKSYFCDPVEQQTKTLLRPFEFNTGTYYECSSSTFGFDRKCSDVAGILDDEGKKTQLLNIKINELKDVVSSSKRQTSNISSKHGANNTNISPLLFPRVASKNSRSPLSPSQNHLLEDLDMEKDFTSLSSTRDCCHKTEDTDGFHNCGTPMSTPWVWHKKEASAFNTSQTNRSSTPKKDKRKLETFKEPISKQRMLCHERCGWERNHSFHTLTKNDKIGLYRVQSCPGIVSQESSNFSLIDQSHENSLKYFTNNSFTFIKKKEIISHESCPDVLQLRDNSLELQSYHHRELSLVNSNRRNRSIIQVS